MFKIFRTPLAILAICPVLVLPLSAHEFWLNPKQYQVQSGDTVRVEFRNGENFSGAQLAYFDRSSTRLQVTQDGKTSNLSPRDGDRPAVTVSGANPGLMVIAHETSRSTIRYKTWEKFAKFTRHKDLRGVEARHQARGLPRDGFTESYSRHAKTLIGVGMAKGADKRMGLETEFVAQTNPYDATFNGTFVARLFYKNTPRPDAQVEVFERKSGGKVRVFTTRTDSSGTVTVPTKPGHTYLLDAVVLRVPEQAKGAAWETVWAALTFASPAR